MEVFKKLEVKYKNLFQFNNVFIKNGGLHKVKEKVFIKIILLKHFLKRTKLTRINLKSHHLLNLNNLKVNFRVL